MSSYKLSYFNFPGVAEPIRFLLSYLNIDFEDYRFEFEQWPSIKQKMPFNKVPVLEIDGKVLNQSVAICRYLAKKAGLAGSDEWESLLIDIAVDNVVDLLQEVTKVVREQNEETKIAKHESLIKEIIPFYVGKFDKIVDENNGYFVNGKLSWADIYFISIVDSTMMALKIDILNDRSNLKALQEKVLSLPQIKKWIEKRPAPKA